MKKQHGLIGLIIITTLLLGASCGGEKPVERQSREVKSATFQIIEGNRWYSKGCYEKAFSNFSNAYELFSLCDDEDGVARSLNNLGSLYRAKKDWDSALLFYEEAARIFKRLENYTDLTQTLSNKAAVYIDRDMAPSAETALEAADKTAKDHGVICPPLLCNRARLYINAGKCDEAKKILANALAVSPQDMSFEYSTLLHTMGLAMEKSGDKQQAALYYTQALDIDRTESFTRFMASDLDALGNVHLSMGEYEAAADYLYRSLKIHTLSGDAEAAEKTSKNLKICIEKMGDKKPATKITEYFLKRWANGEKYSGACE